MTDFNTLMNDNRRDGDDYVNATKWCGAFGTRFVDWLENENTKRLLKALQNKHSKLCQKRGSLEPNQGKGSSKHSFGGLIQTKEGKGGGTYVHPLVAIALAEWLSSDFHVHVLETFKRYLERDITLADEIIQGETNEEKLAWIQKRLEGKIARNKFTDELQERGVKGVGYATNTNAIYRGLFGGKTAAELKAELQVTNLRDGLDTFELEAIKFAETAAIKKMKKYNAYGNAETTKQSADAAKAMRTFLDSI